MKTVDKVIAEERLYEIIVDVARGETYIITDETTGEAIAKLIHTNCPSEVADQIAREFHVGFE